MKRLTIAVAMLVLASLACTLTQGEGDDPVTPTPIDIVDAAATATAAQDTDGERPEFESTADATLDLNATSTPVSAPPTRQATLQPTPLQFNTPIPQVAQAQSNNNAGAANNSAGDGGGIVTGNDGGAIAPVSGDPASGAPQSNGFYFANTILYESGGRTIGIASDGSGGRAVLNATGTTRSLNGLLVSSSGAVARPDGNSITSVSGTTTAPVWASDNQTAYYGSGNNVIQFRGGSTNVVDSVNGTVIRVQISPDGRVASASANQVKVLNTDGSSRDVWTGQGATLTRGPFWTLRGDDLGIYLETSAGERIFIGSFGLSRVEDPNETLQLQSPAHPDARIALRDEGNGRFGLVVWPNAPDQQIQINFLEDASWSPSGSQLVFSDYNNELILLDAATGARSTLVSGAADNPIWSAPLYRLRLY